MLILYLLLIIASYFIGAIPSGVVLAMAFSGKDIRQEGSGNIGATNVTRVLGKKLGALTLAGDLLKGFLPVCIGSYLVSSLNVVCLMGLTAFLGHLFPVYLRFKGGKGVATALGIFLYFAPLVILIEVVVFIAVVGIWRYVSLGSLIAAAAMPLLLVIIGSPKPVVLLSMTFALLIFIKHKANIQRLLNGTENKFGTKKEQNR
jgi:acyl phosphate:glycerol-3-phosphate acyltransferase